MPYVTIEEVKTRSSFEEVAALSDEKITGYIKRAEGWLHREVGRKFRDETDEDVLDEVETAVILLVDYLWFWDDPELRESQMVQMKSERIGSYSYQFGDKDLPDGKTGVRELDNIIDSLKVDTVGVNFLSVTGPTREAKRREKSPFEIN